MSRKFLHYSSNYANIGKISRILLWKIIIIKGRVKDVFFYIKKSFVQIYDVIKKGTVNWDKVNTKFAGMIARKYQQVNPL